eukprot:Skav233057  [mRNA]  locus=scaffold3637:3217:4683:- [translate_table: standard]
MTLPLCHRCSKEVPVEEMAAVKHENQSQVCCKTCHNIHTMIAKHIGIKGFAAVLEPEAQTAFFKQCLAKTSEGPLKFKNVRSLLKEQMISKVVNTSRVGNQGSFQPLEYWIRLGYNGEKIEKNAPSQEHPILGKTYAVDVVVFSAERAESFCEEKILELERTMKKRKDPTKEEARVSKKGKKNAKAPEATPVEPKPEPTEEEKKQQAMLMDLTGLESDSDCEMAGKGHNPDKAAQREAKKEEKRLQKEAQKFHKKLHPVLAKALAAIDPLLPRMEKAISDGEKLGSSLPGLVLDSLKEEFDSLKSWKAAISAGLKDAAAGKLICKDSLGFESDKDVTNKLKGIGEMLKSVQLAKKAAKGSA